MWSSSKSYFGLKMLHELFRSTLVNLHHPWHWTPAQLRRQGFPTTHLTSMEHPNTLQHVAPSLSHLFHISLPLCWGFLFGHTIWLWRHQLANPIRLCRPRLASLQKNPSWRPNFAEKQQVQTCLTTVLNSNAEILLKIQPRVVNLLKKFPIFITSDSVLYRYHVKGRHQSSIWGRGSQNREGK